MAPSCAKPLPLVLGALLATCAAAAPLPPAAPQPATQLRPGGRAAQQPITVDAASSEVDYKTNTVEFNQVVISQGATRVQAEHAHATGLNFANSRWTFDGKVRIDGEQHGSLRSDEAVVEFRDNHLARANITGKPAEFEQQRSGSQQMARGHADEIVYDVNEGTVRLSNGAWLTDGQNEISGPLLVYNVRAQRVQAAASPEKNQRVHIIIVPPGSPGAGKTEPDKPETPRPQPNAQR